MKRIVSLFILAILTLQAFAKDPIKVLAIGNSFSEDAIEQNLWNIGEAAGQEFIIVNMYIGGCSIDRHLECIAGDLPAYRYRRIEGGKTTQKDSFRLSDAIGEEAWDYVSVQQVSGLSGLYESYARLGELCKWVNDHAPQAKIIFHQTWAYSRTSNHPDFPRYGRDQQTMFNAILEESTRAAKENRLKTVVPSGLAIQIARGTDLDSFGDDLTRDGFHLDLKAGRYIAAATWFEVLTGKSVVGNKYCPQGLDRKQLRTAQKCAHKAVAKEQRVH